METMTIPLHVRLDKETDDMLGKMAKNSDSSKIVRLAIQTLYNQWPIVNVPMLGKLNNHTFIDPCNEIENRQARDE